MGTGYLAPFVSVFSVPRPTACFATQMSLSSLEVAVILLQDVWVVEQSLWHLCPQARLAPTSPQRETHRGAGVFAAW